MNTYVDGFVLLVPKNKLKEYTKMAELGKKMWMKYGALDYKECVGDDLSPKGIKMTFKKMTGAKSSELVIFSYIVFKSKAHRDAVNKKVMKDSEMQNPDLQSMPVDMKRFGYGGFKTIVE